MISARQTKNIIEYSLLGVTAFIEPEIDFSISPNNYLSNAIPGTITLSGSIVANDATNISWIFMQGVSVLASGTGLSPLFVVNPAPTITKEYSLLVTYTGGATSQFLVKTVTVTDPGLYGQLTGPTDNIIVESDLDPFVGGLDEGGEELFINLFTITAAATARLVIVVPHSYGIPTDIVDDNGDSVYSEFNLIDDVGDSRYIFTGINTVTPGTYKFKVVY